MLGYKTDTVEYARGERFAGESKYPFKKMLALAIDGLTSLSLRPIRLIASMGLLLLIFALGIAGGGLVALLLGRAWASLTTILIAIFAVGGLNLLGLGIVGEYAGKAYMEAKRRPRFFVDRVLHDTENES